ncbi:MULTISPECIES: pyridoxamine 5'-phosphate oxidase family protein [Methylobacterium]|uniref:Pyridoxine/pyridoxamine 5'-phosphate oxidase n=1 Tax=Methylobacterium thuringiense TaxID=1003091 RepID=A0ABQ4TKI8_9HYPH|nr:MULTISPECIES: pyridoxamine 5'-phosphate oxidase family protein [Methylobacterium]TXN20606.1 pyridoxamine 5'-phosphate oxidase [Methylobacterium sp. WL9]GJE55900.1 Pyridoxine/pyridoxamine 5'-phosphate oxidase [Methylobacterium thuringiense]
MAELPPFYDDLVACHDELWRRLEQGVADRNSGFHTPALATVDLHGRPQVRTVVLRDADRAAGTLRIHCDRRSEKAVEIAATGSAALQAYDRDAKIQIRVDGTAELHTDDWFAESIWTEAQPMSRAVYGIVPGPGTALLNGGGYTLPGADEAILAGRDNFGVVVIRAERLEFLYLDRRGHRRALWLRSDAGWVETWLAP